jgi:hypothetical protein
VSDEADDASRRAILDRRQRFVRMALVGATAAATATACACLSPVSGPDTYVRNLDAGTDANASDGSP